MDYKVDIVMCIDVTGSMQDCIDTVKSRALQFWPDLQDALKAASKNVSDVRVKVIAFRDFEADGANALQESRYFNLSDQGSSDPEEYKQFVSGLVADGGGDEPENALEALTLAIQSDWVQTGDKRRHVIVMFTDASAHKLENANRSNPNYPQNMPGRLDSLRRTSPSIFWIEQLCPYLGSLKPSTLKSSMWIGKEESHSSPRITSVVRIK